MGLLDLLAMVASPELNASERHHLRAIVARERDHQRHLAEQPWESGVAKRRQTREQRLEQRVEDLELALKFLFDALADRGLLERTSLAERVAELKRDLEEDERARAAERADLRAARDQATRDRTVVCVSCGGSVRVADTFASSAGPRCSACHHADE